jgi:uncharacterized protein
MTMPGMDASLAVVARGHDDGSRLRVAVRVRPGAARTVVGGRYGLALVVRATARPAGGAATLAALRAVASAFRVARSDVTLVTGATSRNKVVEVAGPPATLARRFDELLGPPALPGHPAGTGPSV